MKVSQRTGVRGVVWLIVTQRRSPSEIHSAIGVVGSAETGRQPSVHSLTSRAVIIGFHFRFNLRALAGLYFFPVVWLCFHAACFRCSTRTHQPMQHVHIPTM